MIRMIWPQYLLRWKTRAVKSINAIKDGIAMNKFDLSEILFRTVCPNNEIITDDAGKPSVMVYIPKFTMKEMIAGGSDRVHPAFVVNGVERDGFYISKYQNTEIDRRGYSLLAEIPQLRGFDLSRSKCTAKGRGWHLTTIQECAIALWCKKTAICLMATTITARTKGKTCTGYPCFQCGNRQRQGPNRYRSVLSHDHTVAGIWDLNGNLSEWVGGFRTAYGELQVLPDNDGADLLNSQDAGSTAWRLLMLPRAPFWCRTAKEQQRVQSKRIMSGGLGRQVELPPKLPAGSTGYAAATCHTLLLTIPSALRRVNCCMHMP